MLQQVYSRVRSCTPALICLRDSVCYGFIFLDSVQLKGCLLFLSAFLCWKFTMSKRKRVVFSLNDKVKIIKSIKKGESGSKLAQIYGVGTSTISDIKKNFDSIMKFTCALEKQDGISQCKVMKKSQNEILENAVFTWFLQKRACGQPISEPLLCEKALDFN